MIALPGVNIDHYAKVLQAREEMEYVSAKPSKALSIKETVYPNNRVYERSNTINSNERDNALRILSAYTNVTQS